MLFLGVNQFRPITGVPQFKYESPSINSLNQRLYVKVSDDSGMQPLSHPWHWTSSLFSIKLSRLNIIVVVTLSKFKTSKCGRVLWPLVI